MIKLETIKYDELNVVPSPPILNRLIRLFPWVIKIQFLFKIISLKFKNVRNCQFSPGFYLVIDEYLYAKNVNLNDTVFINYAPIIIGCGTKFSGGNLILTSNHQPDNFSNVVAQPVVIGSNVWITYNCIILGGVTIGDNVIVGAGSVITRDIPSNCIASGNPCRVVKLLK